MKKEKKTLSTGILGEIAWIMVILSVLSMVKLAELKTMKDSLYKDNFIKLKMVYNELGAMKENPYMEVSSDMLISTVSSSDLKLFLDFIILKSRPSSLLQESCKTSQDSSFLPQSMCNESLFNNITTTIFVLSITLFSVCYLAKTDHEMEEKSLAETHKR